MKQLTLVNVYQDDSMLRRAFSWLSRIGAAPKFGSRPIAWYQIHQCHAIDTLRAMGIINPVCKKGIITERNQPDKSHRTAFITPQQLFNEADRKSRSA